MKIRFNSDANKNSFNKYQMNFFILDTVIQTPEQDPKFKVVHSSETTRV